MDALVEPFTIARLLVRLMAGLLFFFQGYDKVFRLGLAEVMRTVLPSYQERNLPEPLIRFSVFFTSYVELIGGALLLLGVFQPVIIPLLGIDLIIAAAGMSLVNPMWDTRHVMTRFLLIIVLLMMGQASDVFSLDLLLNK
jgi:putative oxidoreductase